MADTQAWRDEWELSLAAGTVQPGTQDIYLLGLDQFLAWLGEHHPDVVDLTAIRRKHLDAWMGHLFHRGLKRSTRRLRLLAVKFWFSWIIKEPDSPITVNPAALVPLPEVHDEDVPVVTDDDLTALLNTCRGARLVDLRDRAMIRAMFDAGIRVGELAGMDVGDVSLKTQEITVSGKTGKRTVPIGSKTTLAFSKYLRARAARPEAAGTTALWLSTRRRSASGRYTVSGIQNMLVRRVAAAGLDHIHPHMLRHTWAHDNKASGMNDEDLENLAGWKPGSTQSRKYGRVLARSRAREAARRLGRGDRV